MTNKDKVISMLYDNRPTQFTADEISNTLNMHIVTVRSIIRQLSIGGFIKQKKNPKGRGYIYYIAEKSTWIAEPFIEPNTELTSEPVRVVKVRAPNKNDVIVVKSENVLELLEYIHSDYGVYNPAVNVKAQQFALDVAKLVRESVSIHYGEIPKKSTLDAIRENMDSYIARLEHATKIVRSLLAQEELWNPHNLTLFMNIKNVEDIIKMVSEVEDFNS